MITKDSPIGLSLRRNKDIGAIAFVDHFPFNDERTGLQPKIFLNIKFWEDYAKDAHRASVLNSEHARSLGIEPYKPIYTDLMEECIEELPGTLSHETTHIVLDRLGENYGSLHFLTDHGDADKFGSGIDEDWLEQTIFEWSEHKKILLEVKVHVKR